MKKDQRSELICTSSDQFDLSIKEFFDLGFTTTVKSQRFSWPVYSSLAFCGKLNIVKVLHKTQIWDLTIANSANSPPSPKCVVVFVLEIETVLNE